MSAEGIQPQSQAEAREEQEHFPQISKLEFLKKLAEVRRQAAPTRSLANSEVNPELLKAAGLPAQETSIDGRMYNPVAEAISNNFADPLRAAVAIEQAWEHYQSLAS